MYRQPSPPLPRSDPSASWRIAKIILWIVVIGLLTITMIYVLLNHTRLGKTIKGIHTVQTTEEVQTETIDNFYSNTTTTIANFYLNTTTSLSSIIQSLTDIESLVETLHACCSNVFITLTSFIDELLTTVDNAIIGTLSVSCNDGNTCTADILHVNGLDFSYCSNEKRPNGFVCADECLTLEVGTCTNGVCTGKCKGECNSNIFSGSGGPPGCNTTGFEVNDLFSNNSGISPGVNISWVIYPKGNSNRKQGLCIEHQCFFLVPIQNPSVFFGYSPSSLLSRAGDEKLFDQMCQSIQPDPCLVGSISLLLDSASFYSCLYQYKCSKLTSITTLADPSYRG